MRRARGFSGWPRRPGLSYRPQGRRRPPRFKFHVACGPSKSCNEVSDTSRFVLRVRGPRRRVAEMERATAVCLACRCLSRDEAHRDTRRCVSPVTPRTPAAALPQVLRTVSADERPLAASPAVMADRPPPRSSGLIQVARFSWVNPCSFNGNTEAGLGHLKGQEV